jgi:hypothetical protein
LKFSCMMSADYYKILSPTSWSQFPMRHNIGESHHAV